MLFGLNKIFLGIALTVAVSVGGYIYYLKSENETLEANNQKYEMVVEQQEQTIEQKKADIRDIKEANKNVDKQQEQTRETEKNLDQKFNKKERDLTDLSLAKPGLIENIINDATKESIRCNEIAMGAEIKESDKDNSECQELVQ